mgnify:CR=1 FL=1
MWIVAGNRRGEDGSFHCDLTYAPTRPKQFRHDAGERNFPKVHQKHTGSSRPYISTNERARIVLLSGFALHPCADQNGWKLSRSRRMAHRVPTGKPFSISSRNRKANLAFNELSGSLSKPIRA